jgi:hypothetical protein
LSPDHDPACFSLSPDDSSRKAPEVGVECTDRRDPPPAAAGHEVDQEVVPPTASVEHPSTIPSATEVEVALAGALARAADAGRFDVVIQLARELEARRRR